MSLRLAGECRRLDRLIILLLTPPHLLHGVILSFKIGKETLSLWSWVPEAGLFLPFFAPEQEERLSDQWVGVLPGQVKVQWKLAEHFGWIL